MRRFRDFVNLARLIYFSKTYLLPSALGTGVALQEIGAALGCKKMLKRLRQTQGFTILESILAATILSVGLMGGMMVMQNSLVNTVNGDMNTVATQLAAEKVDSILADSQYRGYDYLEADTNYPLESLTGNYSGFKRTVSITEVNSEDLSTPEEGSGIKQVVVTVNWGAHDSQQIAMCTLVANMTP